LVFTNRPPSEESGTARIGARLSRYNDHETVSERPHGRAATHCALSYPALPSRLRSESRPCPDYRKPPQS
jgi:hypothetical protein